MTNELKWRLQELPTGGEIAELVAQEVITKEEAREILFSKSSKDGEDVKSLKSEINFLRELVEKLSSKTNYYPIWQTITTAPYRNYPWFQVYSGTLGSSGTNYASTASTLGSSVGLVSSIGNATLTTTGAKGLTLPRY